MPKKEARPKMMNPYIKNAEMNPCVYCMLHKPANNNFTARISENLEKIENNKNNLSQKTIFGTDTKKNRNNFKNKKK